MHIITIAFLWLVLSISLDLSEHDTFYIISKVLIVPNRCVLWLWLLGAEETERDLVCLCNSGAKIIPL